MGLMNAGTAVGAVAAPPLIALTLEYLNWRWVFFLSGALGLLWTVWWMGRVLPGGAASPLEPTGARGTGGSS